MDKLYRLYSLRVHFLNFVFKYIYNNNKKTSIWISLSCCLVHWPKMKSCASCHTLCLCLYTPDTSIVFCCADFQYLCNSNRSFPPRPTAAQNGSVVRLVPHSVSLCSLLSRRNKIFLLLTCILWNVTRYNAIIQKLEWWIH